MLTYEREGPKEKEREGGTGGVAWNGGKGKGKGKREKEKPIESCLNKVWELEWWKSGIRKTRKEPVAQ